MSASEVPASRQEPTSDFNEHSESSISTNNKESEANTMDLKTFAQDHISEITATAGLVTYALLRKKLTAGGIFAGIFVATVHMIHPWPAFFWLLILFFLFGTFVTKVRDLAVRSNDLDVNLTLTSLAPS